MQERIPLQKAVMGMGTRLDLVVKILPPEVQGGTDHLTHCLKTLWELSQDPEKPTGLLIFKVNFLYPIGAPATWEG